MSTSPASRRAARNRPARRGDERELALLSTAERLLNEGVFELTPLAEIAKLSGVSRSGFYFYFASKDALLSALIVRTLDRLGDALPAVQFARDSDPVKALGSALHGAADLWHEHRAVLMAATESGGGKPDVFERIVQAQRGLITLTASLLRRGSQVGTDREARALAEMLTWMAERNFYVLSRKRPSKRALHAMADRLLAVWILAAGLEEGD